MFVIMKVSLPVRWLYKNSSTASRILLFFFTLKMVFLKCVWLFVASLCAASRHIAVAVDGSDATSEQANNITLRFSLIWSNSTAECDAVLSNPGVAVSYRTDLDSNNWIPLGPLVTIQQAAAASCKLITPVWNLIICIAILQGGISETVTKTKLTFSYTAGMTTTSWRSAHVHAI